MSQLHHKKLKESLLILALNVIVLSSCIDMEKARERQELTQNFGPIFEGVYHDHMLDRVEACQTQSFLGLDQFADGRYLELLEQRVKESQCYISESFHEEIRNLSVNEYTPAEAEAVITVAAANGGTYTWIVTFRKDDGTWKITDIRNLPRED